MADFEDPSTEAPDRIRFPFRVAVRNSLVVLSLIACGSAIRVYAYRPLITAESYYLAATVAAALVLICFAHAYLGSIIGGRKASNIFMIALVVLAIAAAYAWSRADRREEDRQFPSAR